MILQSKQLSRQTGILLNTEKPDITYLALFKIVHKF